MCYHLLPLESNCVLLKSWFCHSMKREKNVQRILGTNLELTTSTFLDALKTNEKEGICKSSVQYSMSCLGHFYDNANLIRTDTTIKIDY